MKSDELRLKYKSDTGLSPFVEIETRLLSEPFDADLFEYATADELKQAINMSDAGWGITTDELSTDYVDQENDIVFVSKEYVEWLESKNAELTNLLNEQQKRAKIEQMHSAQFSNPIDVTALTDF